MNATTSTAATETLLHSSQSPSTTETITQDTAATSPDTTNTATNTHPTEQTLSVGDVTWDENSGSTFLKDLDGTGWGGSHSSDYGMDVGGGIGGDNGGSTTSGNGE